MLLPVMTTPTRGGLVKLSDARIKHLLESVGSSPEQDKRELVGAHGSQYNFHKDKTTNEIVLVDRYGRGRIQTGYVETDGKLERTSP
jgi:hypothetical protein